MEAILQIHGSQQLEYPLTDCVYIIIQHDTEQPFPVKYEQLTLTFS